MFNRPYKKTGKNSISRPRNSVLRWSFAARYKRTHLDCLAPAQSVGPGASPVGLGEGAKPDAPTFSLSNERMAAPKRTAILIWGELLSIFQSA